MKYTFFGFYGWPEDDGRQGSQIEVIRQNFEYWDLKKFTLEEFVEKIKEKIPGINDNILGHYIASSIAEDFGITQEQYKECSWGLLLPTSVEFWRSDKEVQSLLSLFSTCFMRPAFFVSEFGISMINKKVFGNWLHYQNKAPLFKSDRFVDFYEAMISSMRYFNWFRGNVLAWGDEDWRLYMAATFFNGLEEYESSKSIYTWQRESADMATLLEILFTAGESEREEIGYRLRKRAFVLIGWRFPGIEKELKDLYGDRSDFVHGNFYKRIAKEMRKNENCDTALPRSPDFGKLYLTKERVRFILIAYLYLHEKMKTDKFLFPHHENVQKLLEDSVSDTELRARVTAIVKPIIELLPEAKSAFG